MSIDRSNPMKTIRRLANVGSNFEECDSINEEDEDYNENLTEVNAQLPVISNDGYYWIGKDYSNTYKEDFKDLKDFSRGFFRDFPKKIICMSQKYFFLS